MINTIKYGIKNAPPPFSRAVNGNRQIFPNPTDIAMHDIKNSISLPQLARSLVAADAAVGVSVADVVCFIPETVDIPFCKWAHDGR